MYRGSETGVGPVHRNKWTVYDYLRLVFRHVALLKGEFLNMLSWALTFFIIALIAAALGFGGLAGASAGIAKICFFVFLALFVIGLIVPRFRSGAV